VYFNSVVTVIHGLQEPMELGPVLFTSRQSCSVFLIAEMAVWISCMVASLASVRRLSSLDSKISMRLSSSWVRSSSMTSPAPATTSSRRASSSW
jgi:hypothetical protein